MSRPGDPSYGTALIVEFREAGHYAIEKRDRLIYWIYGEEVTGRRTAKDATPAAVLLLSDEDTSAPFLWITPDMAEGDVTEVLPSDWRWPYVAEAGTPIPILVAEILDTIRPTPYVELSVSDRHEAHAAEQDHPDYQGAPA